MSAVRLERNADVLSGTVGDQVVDLRLDVPNSTAGLRGTCLGTPVAGYWHVESNVDTNDPVGVFLGEFGGEPAVLRNVVHLAPLASLRQADLTGTVGHRTLDAEAIGLEITGRSVRGRYDGPPALFALLACTPLYFLPP